MDERSPEFGLRELADAVPVVLFAQIETPDGQYEYEFVGRGVEAVTGLSPRDLYQDAQRLLERVEDADRARLVEAHEASRRSGQPLKHELRVRDAAGQPRWLRVFARPTALPDGRTRWTGYFSTRRCWPATPSPPPKCACARSPNRCPVWSTRWSSIPRPAAAWCS